MNPNVEKRLAEIGKKALDLGYKDSGLLYDMINKIYVRGEDRAIVDRKGLIFHVYNIHEDLRRGTRRQENED